MVKRALCSIGVDVDAVAGCKYSPQRICMLYELLDSRVRIVYVDQKNEIAIDLDRVYRRGG